MISALLAVAVVLGALLLAVLAWFTRGPLDYSTTAQEHTDASTPSSVDAVLAADSGRALPEAPEVLTSNRGWSA